MGLIDHHHVSINQLEDKVCSLFMRLLTTPYAIERKDRTPLGIALDVEFQHQGRNEEHDPFPLFDEPQESLGFSDAGFNDSLMASCFIDVLLDKIIPARSHFLHAVAVHVLFDEREIRPVKT